MSLLQNGTEESWQSEKIIKLTEPVNGTIFSPLMASSEMADRVGIKSDRGNIMTYCWRRFGYPIFGWDEHKELCSWIISTPFSEVFLNVKPSKYFPFGTLFCSNFSSEYENCLFGPRRKKQKRFGEWAKKILKQENNPIPFVTIFDSDEKLEHAFGKWYGNDFESFYAWNTKRNELLWKRWSESSDPEPDYLNNLHDFEKLPWHNPLRIGHYAIETAMRDLLRPVYIRDQAININGNYEGDLPEADIYEKAGYGIGDLEKHIGE